MSENESLVGAFDHGCLIFEGKSIQEVYDKLRERFEKQPGDLFLNVLTRIEEPEQIKPEGCEKTESELKEGLKNLFLEKPQQFCFNHWSRVRHYPGQNSLVDQWKIVAEGIHQQNKYSSISTFIITSPELDFASDSITTPPPFFCMGQFTKDAKSRLGITAVYRRQEMSQWWVANVWELIEYRDMMLKELASEFQTHLLPGPVCMFAISAWWSKEKRIIADLSRIDEPEGLDLASCCLVKIFERKDVEAAKTLADMFREKAKVTTLHNSPQISLDTLIEILRLLSKWFKDRDLNLYNTLCQEIEEAASLNTKLQHRDSVAIKREIVRKLQEKLVALAEVFMTVKGDAKERLV